MTGCLRRVGCALIIVLVLAAAYVTRHRWLPLVTHQSHDVVKGLVWKPLDADGARRAQRGVARLHPFDGPVFANVGAADFAAFVLDSAVQGIKDGSRPAEAAAHDDKIYLRVQLRVADLGAENVPLLGGVANKTATMVIGGTLGLARPGIGEWTVNEMHVDAIEIPGAAIPRLTGALVRHWRQGQAGAAPNEGVPDGSLAFSLPPEIADLRVHNGTLTLYKAVPK
jgi:hypothetical protein